MSGEEGGCRLIGGAFANLLQVVLGLAALASLVIKRWGEVPKREVKVWLYDVSKQVYGSLLVHVWNIVVSVILPVSVERADQCALYFVNFALDLALGLALIWMFLKVQEVLAYRYNLVHLKNTGDYGSPPSSTAYKHQLISYLLVICLVKIIITAVVLALAESLAAFSDALFSPVQAYPDVELVIVMVVCPWFLNALQFWIMDNILMKHVEGTGAAAAGSSYRNMSDRTPANPQPGLPGESSTPVTTMEGYAANRPQADRSVPQEPSWMLPSTSFRNGSADRLV